MNCRTATPLLSAYVDQELSALDSAAVADHLATCTACQFECERIESVRDGLRGMLTVSPPVGLESRLQSSVFNNSRRVSNRYMAFGLIAASSMAAAFLAVQLAGKPEAVPDQPIAHQSTQELDMAANSAYLNGSDPMGGGVPVVTVGYAGGH